MSRMYMSQEGESSNFHMFRGIWPFHLVHDLPQSKEIKAACFIQSTPPHIPSPKK